MASLLVLRNTTYSYNTMVPTWTGKPGNMGKLFPAREKPGNFEHTGKVREFYPKLWKREGNLPKILKSERNLAIFYFYFFSEFFN